ncbi:MAG: cyclic nucleotide-binding domain-containing protein, partial [Anaerolineae bacterium]|nr:cyclic nucleotide-binding domain-containing protein [Anaerolineae bacterium]
MSGDYPVKVKELQEMPVFERLTESQLECLARVMIRRTYAAGQSVFLEGDPAVGVWFVVNGQVRIIKQSSSGRVQGLCVIKKKKCFGTCPLFDGDTNLANAVAVTEVTLAVLPGADLQRLIYEEP